VGQPDCLMIEWAGGGVSLPVCQLIVWPGGGFGQPACLVTVTTMSNSGSYPVTPVASQHSSSTPVAHSYSGHSCTDILPLSMTLGLIPIQSLPYLTVNPAWSYATGMTG